MVQPTGEVRSVTGFKRLRGMPRGLGALGLLKALKPARYLQRHQKPKVYGRIGNLEVRLARTAAEVRLAQHLRYRVFFEEMSAEPSRLAKFRRRDEDAFDGCCDHLLVVDLASVDKVRRHGVRPAPKVVGTYRVLRQDVAERHQGFYTASEFDIAPLIRSKSSGYRFMELGRSCVLSPYRSKRTVELLWHGLWTYVREHKIDVMIGCASFEGTDPREHAMALSFLHHYAVAPAGWRCKALDDRYVSMDLMPKEAVNPKAALKVIPPLIKGYLRLGAFVGDGAVIDRQFGTTDVLIILPVEKIDPRYFDHYGAPEENKSRVAVDA
jgi:L-ornithine Nalpha-acyltransferase